MRPIRLARVALEAEAVRLRHLVRRKIAQTVLGIIALALLLGALVFAHIAAWYWLLESLTRPQTALIFAGADLLLAVILTVIVARSSPGRVELEALALRRRALDDAEDSLSLMALLVRLIEHLIPPSPKS